MEEMLIMIIVVNRLNAQAYYNSMHCIKQSPV